MQRTHFTAGYTLYNCVCDRAVRYGPKKNYHDFLKKKIDFDFNHDFDTNRHALQL